MLQLLDVASSGYSTLSIPGVNAPGSPPFAAAGRQVAMGDATGMTTYTLDAVGRQVLVNNWVGTPITYALDPVGNRTYVKDPDGHYWTYEWDADGGLRTVWNSYNQTTTLTHDALGREVQRTLANGGSVNRTFDAAGRETNLQAVNAAGAALSGYTATYDPAGNRLTVLELDGTRVTYTNDASYQLTREQRGGAHPIDDTLQYDGVGNRVSKVDATGTTTYQVNAANELVLTTPPTGAPTTSTWDADGNLAVENTGGQLTTHTWDADNRLVRIDKPDGTWETNTYRADGLRSSHEDTDGLVYFVWDDQNVLLEKNSSKVTRAIYTQLPGIWGGAFSYRRGADHYYLLPDFQGHTRQLTNAAGAIFEPHIYDAWGREIWPIVTTGLYLRGFGQWGYWRDATSRLYVRARHLRVELGRWMSRDPVEGEQPYGYALNQPARLGDPHGLYVVGPPISFADWRAGRTGYMYTCNCGWVDSHHLSASIMAAKMMHHWASRAEFAAVNFPFAAVHPVVSPVLEARANMRIRRANARFTTDPVWRRAAAYVAYTLLWRVEEVQDAWRHPSGYSYEDLPTDWLGALAYWRGDQDLGPVLRECGPVSRDDAARILCHMEDECRLGGSGCHHGLKIRVSDPNNPLPRAIQLGLFHERYPNTRACCSGTPRPPALSRPGSMLDDGVVTVLERLPLVLPWVLPEYRI